MFVFNMYNNYIEISQRQRSISFACSLSLSIQHLGNSLSIFYLFPSSSSSSLYLNVASYAIWSKFIEY